MLKNKIKELKMKIEEARQDLLNALNNKYSYAVNIGELSNEFVVLLAQLEALEEVQEDIEEA